MPLPQTICDIVSVVVVVVICVNSQQTKTSAGLHKSIWWEASGKTDLRAESCPPVHTGWNLHQCYWYVQVTHHPVSNFLCQNYTCNTLRICVFVVIVTEYANHARDHLKMEAELKKFDGWVLFVHNRSSPISCRVCQKQSSDFKRLDKEAWSKGF